MAVQRIKNNDLLTGTWVSLDEISYVKLCVRKRRNVYHVSAKDSFDGETAAISEEKHDKKTGVLSFAAYWTSSGRFTRYRMQALGDDKVEITYTHTDTEILIKKEDLRNGQGPN